ncbi:hypothetical protein P3T24_005141 [Paraburkholderia sp. GAS33]
MPIKTPRLHRDRKSGGYFFRYKLPAILAERLGKVSVYQSLKTKDFALALRPKANPSTDRSVYAGALARRITKERLHPDMGMKQGTYTAKNIESVLMGRNVERVQFNGAGDILVKKDIADTGAKNAIQPFKAKIAEVRIDTSTSVSGRLEAIRKRSNHTQHRSHLHQSRHRQSSRLPH